MEKFIVSARKYRPQTFDTVVGQEHITTTLKNAVRSGQLAHAFLFTGPRGVGKTTCARILAKTINCEQLSPEGEACNECSSCRSFNDGASLNIHELDAASNNSVDDIRSLVEQVRFAPQAGRYKVYIIDEVHMLSQSAFNAFLKTLEEPPSYAIFILATTEKHKILPTILSRCQIFDFKRITLQDTVQHLAGIARKEGVQSEETALQLIAQKSEGCMRDALSILDKIVSFTGGDVNYSNTVEHLNVLDADYFFRLTECMLTQDLAGAMLLFDEINRRGFEGDAVLNGMAEFLRNLLMCRDERVAPLLEVVDAFRQRYAEMARRTDTGYLISALHLLNEAEIAYRSARNKRLHVELALIRLCYLQQALSLASAPAEAPGKAGGALRFRTLRPIPAKATPAAATPPPPAPKLVIEAPPSPSAEAKGEPPRPQVKAGVAEKKAPKAKIGSLEAIRQQVDAKLCVEEVADRPLEITALQSAWKAFIEDLKGAKNPAWQSFDLAELHILDAHSFEATASNNLQQKFLEIERNKACEYLQRHLCNRQLQFSILLTEAPAEATVAADLPLSSKEQYLRMSEAYPLVRELRERLGLELDW